MLDTELGFQREVIKPEISISHTVSRAPVTRQKSMESVWGHNMIFPFFDFVTSNLIPVDMNNKNGHGKNTKIAKMTHNAPPRQNP